MSTSFNRIQLMGNLTKNPELRYLPGGTAIVEVPIAVNERYKKSGDTEYTETVSFFDLVFWNRTAEVVNEYLSKGSPVFIEGRLKQDRYEKDGEKRSKVKVVVEQMRMIGGKPADDSESAKESDLVGAGTGNDDTPY